MKARQRCSRSIKPEEYKGQLGSSGYPGPTRPTADAQEGGAADAAYPLKGPLRASLRGAPCRWPLKLVCGV